MYHNYHPIFLYPDVPFYVPFRPFLLRFLPKQNKIGQQISFKSFVIYNRSPLQCKERNVISFLWLMLNSSVNSPENVYAMTSVSGYFSLGLEVKRCRVKIRLDPVLAAAVSSVQRRPYRELKDRLKSSQPLLLVLLCPWTRYFTSSVQEQPIDNVRVQIYGIVKRECSVQRLTVRGANRGLLFFSTDPKTNLKQPGPWCFMCFAQSCSRKSDNWT